MKIDFIADVHGYTDQLEAMLKTLGYHYSQGAYRHSDPARIAVSVGDLMDRGPRQRDAIDIFRRMRDAGTGLAIMGNHEHAAIGWTIPDPLHPGEFLRKHSDKNLSHHKAFLAEVGENSSLHFELVGWMKTMPLVFRTESVRSAHACWDQSSLAVLEGSLTENWAFSEKGLIASFAKDTAEKDATDIVLRGPEVDLPHPVSYFDVAGHRRTKARLRWWKDDSDQLHEVAITDDDCVESLKAFETNFHRPLNDIELTPIIFGHYWLSGQPRLLSSKRACLDYSVAAGGPLVAYRWDGEETLIEENLVILTHKT